MWTFEKYYKTPKILFSKLLKLTGSSRYQLANKKKKKKKKKKDRYNCIFNSKVYVHYFSDTFADVRDGNFSTVGLKLGHLAWS